MGDSPKTKGVDPLVSIIVPVRDGESCIGDTLESALGRPTAISKLSSSTMGRGTAHGPSSTLGLERDSRVRILAQANRGGGGGPQSGNRRGARRVHCAARLGRPVGIQPKSSGRSAG